MTRRHSDCDALADDLDALLDDALEPEQTLLLRRHLRDCDGCRQALAQLRAVRALLAGSAHTQAPRELSARLTGIAGESSDRPLWMACEGQGQLDSPRARRRRLALTSTVTVLMVSVLVLGLGLVLSPALPTVADAKAVANLEYDLSTGSGAVAGAVSAVQATSPGQLRTTTEVDSPRVMSEITWRAIGADAVKALLEHAARPSVGYWGVQTVMLGSDADFVIAEVEVSQQPGSPLTVVVLGPDGSPLSSGLLSVQGQGRQAVLPAAAASFQQAPGGQIAGQATTLVEAHRADGSLLARWWIAEALGLVMWSESFDADQQVVRSAGFSQFRDTTTTIPEQRHLQLSLAPQVVHEAAGRICVGGFSCPTEVAGLPLIELRADSASQATVVCALYGEGDTRVSVMMRRGQLDDGTPGRSYGLTPDRVSRAWQSGTVVYVVTTNAGPGLADVAAAELPHDQPSGRSIWHRARLGLQRLLG